MPNFTTAPPEHDGPRGLPIKRTPTMSRLKAAVTCHELIGCNTHFYGGHTVPCEAPNCEACRKGIPWRWHGYLSAIAESNREHFLYEMTAQAADTVREYFLLHSTMRGCIISAERMHHRQNGRVILSCKPGDLARLNLPEPPNIEACLAIIWSLPAGTTKPDGRKKNHKAVTTDPDEIALREAMDKKKIDPKEES